MTKVFLKHLLGQRFTQVSLVCIYPTIRHFIRLLDRKFPELFPLGCPTDRGVRPLAEPMDDWKGLTHLGGALPPQHRACSPITSVWQRQWLSYWDKLIEQPVIAPFLPQVRRHVERADNLNTFGY
jgi:hypothetical protein